MADAQIQISPLATGSADLTFGTESVALPGVRLSPAPPAARWSLRARDAGTLAALIGRPLPERIGDMADGIVKLGPDEWYAVLPADAVVPQVDDVAASLVEISSRAVGIVIEGEAAAALLASGCPLDLDRMAPGRATRTVFETVEIIILREADTRFRLEVWRSFAPWLWNALIASAS